MPARSVNNFVFAQPPELVVESSEDYLDAAEDKMYGYSTKETEDDVKRFYSNSDDSLGEDTHTYSSSYSSGSKDPVSINFGILNLLVHIISGYLIIKIRSILTFEQKDK